MQIRAWLSKYALVGIMVALVTVMHYSTAIHLHAAHGIYRRLYYFPILIAAFRGGWKAGLTTALLVCAVYIPHAFGGVGFDPGPTLEKVLEMVLYIAVGLVCGILVSRANRALRSLKETATRLKQAIVEKSAMENELVRSAKLAAMGRLSAGLAHEIRNPLASIKGAADILADDFPQNHPKGNLLRIIGAETHRLNDVLTRFLAFARPSDRRNEIFDLREEIEEVVELVRHQGNVCKISLLSCDSKSWQIEGDRKQIRQLLFNLILNGAEATGPGGQVEITLLDEDSWIHCCVDDNGPGFSGEAIANLGTPFFTTKEGGTGLGLAICYRIVEDHNGRLRVDVSPLGGARIKVEMPRRQARSVDNETSDTEVNMEGD
jgi:signal transduction histidine kinase